jgi:hypothetical protein
MLPPLAVTPPLAPPPPAPPGTLRPPAPRPPLPASPLWALAPGPASKSLMSPVRPHATARASELSTTKGDDSTRPTRWHGSGRGARTGRVVRRSRPLVSALFAVLPALPFSGCGGRSERTLPAAEEPEQCSAGQCTLVWDDCCPPCGDTDPSRYHAVRSEDAAAYFANACPRPHPCPACGVPSPPVVATCTPNGCDVLDLAPDPALACKLDGDCRARTKDCCECGGNLATGNLIAISDEGRYSALVCPPVATCNDCAPTYENAPPARCEGGRCTLRD